MRDPVLYKVSGKQETEWIIMETSARDGCLHPGQLDGSASLGNGYGVESGLICRMRRED